MTRDIRKDMTDYLPRYYADSRIVAAILDPESAEYEQIHAEIGDLIAQVFIDTATWGLDRWEKIAQIPVDHTKTYEQRREILKARFRGMGTVRIDTIKNLAAAYSNGDVDVDEGLESKNIMPSFADPRWEQLISGTTYKPDPDDPYRLTLTAAAGQVPWAITFPCKGSTQYTASAERTDCTLRVKQYDKDGSRVGIIQDVTSATPLRTFTTEASTAALRIEIVTSSSVSRIVDLQIERGSVRTAFQPLLPPYTILIRFIGSKGVPEQLAALQTEIRKLIPAHLALKYQFVFYLYGQLQATGTTYGDVKAKALTYAALYNKGV